MDRSAAHTVAICLAYRHDQLMTVATLQLREPGPTQSNVMYHFCARPPVPERPHV
jgi:hypothetical protein